MANASMAPVVDPKARGRMGRAARVAARRQGGCSTALGLGVRGGAYRPLTDRDMERIHDTALDVLEKVGVGDVTDEIREIGIAKGCRMSSRDRLCFPRALIEDLIAGAPKEIWYHGRDESRTVRAGGERVYFGTSGEAVRWVDPDTGKYRPSTLVDLYDFYRLADRLDHIDMCGQTVVATDICEDARLHAVNIAYAGAAATTKPFGVSLADPRSVADVIRLWDMILGEEGAFKRRPFASIGACPVVSPLRFDPDTAAVMCEAARHGVTFSAVSAPLAGATAPAALAGALVLSVAEALVIVAVVNMINPGGHIDLGPWPFVTDLRTGAFTGGGGEQAVMMAAAGQLARFYGLPGSVAAGMTDAKRLDYQAGYEKGLTVALGAVAGATMISECAGMMASLIGCSLESMVIDNDLIGSVKRALRGVEVTDETLSYEVIERSVLGPGHFLADEQTLALMESEYVYPQVADRTSVSEWESNGLPDIVALARRRVKAIMATHYPPYIEPDRDRRVRDAFPIRLAIADMRSGNGRW